jgi:peroxiredoxin
MPESETAPAAVRAAPPQEARRMVASVGKEAPDFEANAFVRDVGFKPVKLSDYKGQWVVLCFFPGAFTFV